MEIQAPQSLRKRAGDDVLLTLTVTDEDDVAVDITGFSVAAWVAKTLGGTAVLSTESSPATITATLSDPTNGVFTLAFADTDTDDLIGTYRYQVKLTDTGALETTVNHGYITFDAKIA